MPEIADLYKREREAHDEVVTLPLKLEFQISDVNFFSNMLIQKARECTRKFAAPP